MHLLEVKSIRVLYGKAIALNGLTLSLDEKEMVGVVGPNGAGKTTLLRAISAMVPAEGEIFFQGDRIDHHPPHEIVRKGIIHCPERRQLFVEFTVAENLEMGAFLRRDKKKVEADLKYVYGLFPVLEERKSQLAGTLSGGEQQMLAIARALMSRPELLLLDEPSMGLAPLVVSKIIGHVVKAIHEAGTTIFLSEQNARMALMISRRGYVLENGKIVLHGSNVELMNDEKVKKAYIGA